MCIPLQKVRKSNKFNLPIEVSNCIVERPKYRESYFKNKHIYVHYLEYIFQMNITHI